VLRIRMVLLLLRLLLWMMVRVQRRLLLLQLLILVRRLVLLRLMLLLLLLVLVRLLLVRLLWIVRRLWWLRVRLLRLVRWLLRLRRLRPAGKGIFIVWWHHFGHTTGRRGRLGRHVTAFAITFARTAQVTLGGCATAAIPSLLLLLLLLFLTGNDDPDTGTNRTPITFATTKMR
jgi:hypothetical protein